MNPGEEIATLLVCALAGAQEASAAGVDALEGSPYDLFHRAERACEALLAQIDRTEASE